MRPAPAEAPPPGPGAESVIAALPPPDTLDVAGKAAELESALGALQLDRSLHLWRSFFVATDSFRALPAETYGAISRFVVGVLAGPGGVDVGAWGARDPGGLQALQHMAVEAAVRDEWRGLSALQLGLIGAGRPHDVVAAYARFKARLWAHQRKDPQGLRSWDRAQRLAARLTGDGLVPLMLGNVAAQTMLAQFDHAALTALLDSAFDPRLVARDRLDLSALKHQMRSRANRGTAGGDAVWAQFLANIDKVTLAIQCYHSKALVTRIRALARQGDAAKVGWLYDALMRASAGPDRFIIPIDSGNRSANYNFVPLGMDVWGECARTNNR